ncbi:hypothetical protein EHRUM3_10280 [Ehrlichia ruminantium]|uniref:Uncharacterized protein n=1 Tax=Ehrlichia ruminantium TaxID=779 RepID=A0A170TE64_EHRRU|nr:hypothetical protein EHRUM3_10280 [Ehrlichia ruminantium]
MNDLIVSFQPKVYFVISNNILLREWIGNKVWMYSIINKLCVLVQDLISIYLSKYIGINSVRYLK